MKHVPSPAVRRLARSAAAAPVLLVPLVALPAAADVPETWEDGEAISPFEVLLLLGGVPLLLFLVIALLVYLPSMRRGERYQPGLAWRNESEWFGGPREGVGVLDKTEPDAGQSRELESEDPARGGAHGRW